MTTGRKAVWRRGRLYIPEHPVLGVGAGNFLVAEGITTRKVGNTGKWSAAHNAYIQAFAELGSVGGGTFVIMLLMAARIAYRSWRPRNPARGPPFHRPELLAALVAYMTGAMFLSHAYFHPLFALIAFILLSQRIREAEALGGMVDAGMVPIAEIPAPVQGRRGGFLSVRLY